MKKEATYFSKISTNLHDVTSYRRVIFRARKNYAASSAELPTFKTF
jgi:hypothetical protein